jgi:hypothetical protein
VIGTCHPYQRHQDKSAEREVIRTSFEKLIRTALNERGINLVAEEAGNNEAVHAQLKADEAKTVAFSLLFAGTEAVDKPQDTIAKIVADEVLGGKHIAIRLPGDDALSQDAD